ncbi:MAG: hypothetical protein ACFFEA_01335 [Candidatus Thorarchaeota archaeon]
MGEDEEETKKSKKKKADDYTELEFELGELEFEAKGKSKIVERMFYTLLEKLETGKLKAITSTVKELEDAVDMEEEEEEEVEEEEVEEEEEEEIASEGEPPPKWEMLDTETPPESEPEREARESE